MLGANAVILRVTLDELDPAPWRETEIRLSSNLKTLHDAIQAAFCWYDYHLWEFQTEHGRYTATKEMDWGDSPVFLARNARLAKLIDQGVTEFGYVYDMGDDWHHYIEVLELTSVADEERLPRFIAGEHAAPPEDIGGPPGYEHFLEVLDDPKHPDREMYEELIEELPSGKFDSNDIQLDTINGLMSRIARRKPRKST